jgi:hypothetical protein
MGQSEDAIEGRVADNPAELSRGGRESREMRLLIPLVVSACVLLGRGDTWAETPVTYRRTIEDADGVRHRVNLRGGADRGRLTGVVSVDGRNVEIVALVGKDRSISGNLADPATGERGSFSGVLDKDQLLGGRFNLGPHAGRWTAPGFVMPERELPTTDDVTRGP